MTTGDEIKITDFSIADRLNAKIRPQDDFFRYANSKWLDANPIPDTEGRWSNSNVLHEKSLRNLRAICEELKEQSGLKPGTPEQQIRDFYLSGLNFNKHKTKNLKALQVIFEKIDSTTEESLNSLLGYLHRIGINDPFCVLLDADDKNSKVHIARLRQSGLTLPDRDYYLDDSKKMASIRSKYQKFVKNTHKLLPGLAETANELWDKVWSFELKIAKVSRSSVDLRDVEKNYNKTTVLELNNSYSNIDWAVFAHTLGWKIDDNITVDQPEFMHFIDDCFISIPLQDWKTYLKWQTFVAYGARVSNELAIHRFSFFGKVLSGIKTMPPLWKRVLSNVDTALGEAMGAVYAKKYFPASSKRQVLDIVEDIRDTYAERIMNLDWMTDKTKMYALKKLGNIRVLIGYPDRWRDYSKLTISPDNYLENLISSEEFETKHELKKLQKPVSRREWFMNPQTVNAYHDPNRLVICFPAAILQPPFFDPNASYAANMGGIGSVIAHEFTHGFDDQGCHFDADGNMQDWQTEADQKAFTMRAQIIIDQANKFEVMPGLCLKGGLVIGECIADLGGLEIAFNCLKKKSANSSKNIRDESREFFISYAACECGQTRSGLKRQFAISDPHPDEEFRVNGIIQHCDDFHETYMTNPNDKLYRSPENRAKIW